MAFRVALLVGGLAAALAGCQPRVVGEWWSVGRQTADGEVYENHLVVERDNARLTLHALVPGNDPEEVLVATGAFQGAWDRQRDFVGFDLYCDWEGCTFDPRLRCTLDEELWCSITPEFYAREGDLLRFERVGPPPE